MAGLEHARSIFNIGSAFLIPPGSNVEGERFGVIRSLSVDFGVEVAELRGENFYVEEVARKTVAVSGKVAFAKLTPELILSAVPGTAKTTGSYHLASETSAVPATPFQITVTNSAKYASTLEVKDNTAGYRMLEVASAPAAGEYSVSAGVYTFNTADSTHSVTITYDYTETTGVTVTGTNAMAEAPSTYYSLRAYNTTKGKTFGIHLPRVVIPGLSLPLSQQDFAAFEFSFTAMPDASGILFKILQGA